MTDDDEPQTRRLAELFAALADDPAAPPSAVTPLSVIAAAKRAAPDVEADAGGDKALGRHGRSFRSRLLMGALVAASVVAVGAIVVPVVLRGDGGGSMSGSGSEAAMATSADGQESVAALDSAGGQGGTAAANAAAPSADSLAAERGSEQDAAGTGPVCTWPALSDGAAAAAAAALPADRFATVTELSAPCRGEPLAGNAFVDDATGASVLVTVSRAAEGSCRSDVPAPNGLGPCVAGGPGRYEAPSAVGPPLVFAYADGLEVAVDATGAPDLDAGQLVSLAEAVLATGG